MSCRECGFGTVGYAHQASGLVVVEGTVITTTAAADSWVTADAAIGHRDSRLIADSRRGA
ncbi:hypothetical protein DMB37_29700 [Nocardia sp. CS682]|nr:hypothetical protein DMB37_29700 [Nocardia sp. CS682]